MLNKRLKTFNYPVIGLVLFIGLLNIPTVYAHITSESMLGLMGLLLVPFIVQRVGKKVKVSIYHILTIIAAFAFFVIKSPIILFLGLWWLIYAFVEQRWGKLNALAFFLPIFFSRIFRNWINIMAFPIRLKLTKLASITIHQLGPDVKVLGSEIVYNGGHFFVDTACVGLNMVSASYTMLFVMLAFHERIKQRIFNFLQVIGFIVLNLILILFSNYLRIVLIIVLKSEAASLSHELIGLGSLIVFNLLSMYLIVKFVSPSNSKVSHVNKHILPSWSLVCTVLPFLFFCVAQIWLPRFSQDNNAKIVADNWTSVEDRILEKKRDETTMYLKKQNPWSITNHNPLICWRGSGYQIFSEKVMEVGDRTVYLATLKKEQEILKTAWWYESEEKSTIDEWEWRMRSHSKGEHFFLVNFTSPTESELLNQLCMFKGIPKMRLE